MVANSGFDAPSLVMLFECCWNKKSKIPLISVFSYASLLFLFNFFFRAQSSDDRVIKIQLILYLSFSCCFAPSIEGALFCPFLIMFFRVFVFGLVLIGFNYHPVLLMLATLLSLAKNELRPLSYSRLPCLACLLRLIFPLCLSLFIISLL